MTTKELVAPSRVLPLRTLHKDRVLQKLDDFPWWFLGVCLVAVWVGTLVLTHDSYRVAFNFIKVGLSATITTTLFGFSFALVIGLLVGFGRISTNLVARNVSTFYVELIRGIPMLVLIFFIALVGVPAGVGALNELGAWLNSIGAGFIGSAFTGLQVKSVSMNIRAIVALAVTYGAFEAEIFRAGIQSIDKGQMEAARASGMSYIQAMWYVILPQAVRNMLPALGNEFIAMLKDSALVSVLAVRDITQVAKLYSGQSFKYQETYIILAAMYLTMTIALSLLVKLIERKAGNHARNG